MFVSHVHVIHVPCHGHPLACHPTVPELLQLLVVSPLKNLTVVVTTSMINGTPTGPLNTGCVYPLLPRVLAINIAMNTALGEWPRGQA